MYIMPYKLVPRLTRVWKSTYVIFIGLRVHAEVRLIQVPLLATQRLRKAYTYADDDRVTLTYPAVMAEIDAIKALRTRNASDFLASDPSGSGLPLGSNLAVRNAVEQMMTRGWVRTKWGFDEVKRKIWAANDLVVSKLLHDLT